MYYFKLNFKKLGISTPLKKLKPNFTNIQYGFKICVYFKYPVILYKGCLKVSASMSETNLLNEQYVMIYKQKALRILLSHMKVLYFSDGTFDR